MSRVERHAQRGHRSAALMAAALTLGALAGSGTPAQAEPAPSAECADVVGLAVPGTWETNAGADRNVVPGMLANISGPVTEAVARESTTVASTRTTSASSRTSSTASHSGQSIRWESVPYIAEVGGAIAGPFTGNSATLSESSQSGMSALSARADEIGNMCPLTKFIILGYSQGALVAGDFLSEVGNRRGTISPESILAGALLSDPKRSASTSTPDVDSSSLGSLTSTKLRPQNETFVGSEPGGRGVLGEREGGMGVLAERVVSVCATSDTICSLSSQSKVVAAIVPLLNLRPEDIPDFVTNKALTLLKNVASADPQDLQRAIASVITQMTRLAVAGSTNPAMLPLELAQVVFASSMLDDVAKVVNMPEFDALVSLTNPEELIQQAGQAASYLLLDAHRSYANYKVDGAGDSATQWIVKWLAGKVEARG